MRVKQASEAEKIERDRLCHPEWGQKLTVEQFLRRELSLRAHAWPRDAMRTWILEGDSGEPLASCETYLTRSRIGDGEGSVYSVASVFTEPRLRGNGYASVLLNEVVGALEHEDPRMHGMALYSDVGPEIYARLGYVARPTQDWVLKAASGSEQVELLDEKALRAAWPVLPPAWVPGSWVLWPTADQLDWHLERERVYARLIGTPRSEIVGARGHRGGIAAWAVDSKARLLRVLALLSEDPEETEALARAAAHVAAGLGVPEVRSWTALPGAALADRDGSIPMIRPTRRAAKPEEWLWAPRALWV